MLFGRGMRLDQTPQPCTQSVVQKSVKCANGRAGRMKQLQENWIWQPFSSFAHALQAHLTPGADRRPCIVGLFIEATENVTFRPRCRGKCDSRILHLCDCFRLNNLAQRRIGCCYGVLESQWGLGAYTMRVLSYVRAMLTAEHQYLRRVLVEM